MCAANYDRMLSQCITLRELLERIFLPSGSRLKCPSGPSVAPRPIHSPVPLFVDLFHLSLSSFISVRYLPSRHHRYAKAQTLEGIHQDPGGRVRVSPSSSVLSLTLAFDSTSTVVDAPGPDPPLRSSQRGRKPSRKIIEQ